MIRDVVNVRPLRIVSVKAAELPGVLLEKGAFSFDEYAVFQECFVDGFRDPADLDELEDQRRQVPKIIIVELVEVQDGGRLELLKESVLFPVFPERESLLLLSSRFRYKSGHSFTSYVLIKWLRVETLSQLLNTSPVSFESKKVLFCATSSRISL